jgi:hypothetical protein
MSMSLHPKWAFTLRPQSINRASTEPQQSLNRVSTKHQQSFNRVSTECQQSFNRASTEGQRFPLLHSVYSDSNAAAFTHNRSIARHGGQYGWSQCRYTKIACEQCVNRALTIFAVASCIIHQLCYRIFPQSKCSLPWYAILLVLMLLPPKTESQWSVNNIWLGKWGN